MHGSQAIHLATWHSDNTDIIGMLLDGGASVYAKSTDGYTLLHWAVIFGCTSNVEFLLRRGAEAEWEGKNALLQKARTMEDAAVVKLLEDYKRNPTKYYKGEKPNKYYKGEKHTKY